MKLKSIKCSIIRIAERGIQNEERMEFILMFFDKIQSEYEIPEDMFM